MEQHNNFTLVNPKSGNLAFKLYTFNKHNPFDHLQRLNYYTLVWIKKGKGRLKADFSAYSFAENNLCCFSPYQPFMLIPEEAISGVVINFHPDFFCIHKHQKEVACNGVLFNNIYSPTTLQINEQAALDFDDLIEKLKTELEEPALAHYELLISYLKIFLITASRIKTAQTETQQIKPEHDEPFVLQNLKNFIETHYRAKHTARDYADLLAITPKALTKLTKTHFNKTLTDLIAERIVIEAKRELYLTNKTVKEIAHELGYNDEYYFSRFFKKNTDVSPQLYRETVGVNKLAQA